MRAILIDPVARTMTEVDYDGDYKSIYRLIDVDMFEVMQISDIESVFIDEEGLLKEPAPTHYFKIGDDGHPLSGKGLVLGVNDEGDSIATQLTIDELSTIIQFVRLTFHGFQAYEGTVNHPILGPNTPLIGQRAIFGPFDEESR